MKAIQFEQHGEPEVLQLVQLPKPQPALGQVLIRVAAAGINYAGYVAEGKLRVIVNDTFALEEAADSDLAPYLVGCVRRSRNAPL